MVVLTNRNSASASEIVSGALQDHDRAYLVGETTFGKALVQSVYRISGGAGLALTTAHYYTPSGRLIQRPWDAVVRRVPQLLDEGSGREQGAQPERLEADRCRPSGLQRRRHRARSPHRRARSKASIRRRFGRVLYSRQEFANYAQKFTADGDTRITQTATGRQIAKPNFDVDDAMIADFKELVKSRSLQDRRSGVREGQGVHPRDDSLRDRPGALRHRRGAAAPARQSIHRRRSALGLFSEAAKLNGLGKGAMAKLADCGTVGRTTTIRWAIVCSLPL